MTDQPETFRGPISWRPREQRAFRWPRRLSVSQWVERHRTLPDASARPGRFRYSWTPYFREPVDAVSDPAVDRLTIMAAAQCGKSESIVNAIGYLMDQDPGPTLLVMPRDEDVIQVVQRRIRPMLESTPRLARLISDAKTDNKLKEIKLERGMLYGAGSNSPADLASKPIRYLFMDEVDKYPPWAGREADPVSLALERTTTYLADRKVILTSTPTTRNGLIWREWDLSDKREFHVPCPRCGVFSVLRFEQVKWPKEIRDPEKLEGSGLADYECPACLKRWGDGDKFDVLQRGVWCPERAAVTPEGQVVGDAGNAHRGYHISRLYVPWVSFSQVAAEFLRSRHEAQKLMNFNNSWLGWIFEQQVQKTDADHLGKRVAEHTAGTIPNGAVLLTAGVDVQKDILYYVVRAWGVNEQSWLVVAGRVETFEQLERALATSSFPFENGERLRLRLACVDSGYRTDEVYAFCSKWRDLARPVKGQQTLTGIPYRAVRIERNLRGDPFDGAMSLFHVDTTWAKDKLSRLIHSPPGSPGEWWLHREPSEEYLAQVASEHKVLVRDKTRGGMKEEWVVKPGAYANHWLDAEVYALVAAEMLGVPHLKSAEEEAKAMDVPAVSTRALPGGGEAAPAPRRREGGWTGGGWSGVGRRGRWM